MTFRESTLTKAWLASLGFMLAMSLVWYACAASGFLAGPANLALRLMPAPAAVFMGVMAPRRKILNALLLALPVGVILGIVNLVDEKLDGYTSFPGIEGVITVTLLLLPWNLALCAIGAGVGRILVERNKPDSGSTADTAG